LFLRQLHPDHHGSIPSCAQATLVRWTKVIKSVNSAIKHVILIVPLFRSSIWTSTLFIPVYLGLVSATVGILHIILLTTPLKKYFVTPPSTTRILLHVESDPPTGFLAEIKGNIKSNAGLTIWTYKVLRLIGCLALVAFSVVAAVIATDDTYHTEGKHWGKKHRGRHGHKGRSSNFSDYAWIQIVLTAFYVRFTPRRHSSSGRVY
jgi:hypothetical protein